MIETSLRQSDPVLLPGRPFGRGARSVIAYALLTALMIVTRLPAFVPAALLHCATRHGRRIGWVVLIVAVMLVAFVGASVEVGSAETQKAIWSTMAAVVLTLALPSLAAAPMVARGEAFGRVLMFVLAGALVGLALTEIASQTILGFSPYAAQLQHVTELGRSVVKLYRDVNAPADVVALAERLSRLLVYLLPAQVVMTICVYYILSLLMLGRLRFWQDHAARRESSETMRAYQFRNFALPDWVLFLFIFGGLTPIAGGLLQKVAANTLAVVVFLYILQGAAIFRSLLVTTGVGAGVALLAWMTLLFLAFTGATPVLLGTAGLFDSFFDFRHFKKRKDDSHESHSD